MKADEALKALESKGLQAEEAELNRTIAKRCLLGRIRFIGELFKLGIVSSRCVWVFFFFFWS